MKIKVTISCSGLSFSFAEGQVVDVDKKIGEDLVKCGFAEEIKAAKSAKKDTKPKISDDDKPAGDDDGADD